MALSPLQRIGGLASGLDTDSIISQLVAVEKTRITSLQTKTDVSNARTSGLQDISNKLSTLRSAATALRSSNSSSQVAQKVTSSDTAVLDVTRTGGVAPGGYKIDVKQLARAEQQASGPLGASFDADGKLLADDVLTLKLGPDGAQTLVEVKAGDDLKAIRDRINASGASVYANIGNDGTLHLAGKRTGAANTLSVTSAGATAADLNLAVTKSAQDASFSVDGVDKTSASNDVTDVLPGATITLKGTGVATVNAAEPASDAEALADKVKAFVDAYNAVLNSIGDKTSEKRVRASEQKTAADRVKGSLYGDPLLQGIAASVRSLATRFKEGADSNYDTLADIGITLPKVGASANDNAARRGLMSFDRAKFIDSYNANPDAVRSLVDDATDNSKSEGFAQAVERIVKPLVGFDGTFSNALAAETSNRRSLADQIDRVNLRATTYEQRLRRQFTAMEAALLQSQQTSQRLAAYAY